MWLWGTAQVSWSGALSSSLKGQGWRHVRHVHEGHLGKCAWPGSWDFVRHRLKIQLWLHLGLQTVAHEAKLSFKKSIKTAELVVKRKKKKICLMWPYWEEGQKPVIPPICNLSSGFWSEVKIYIEGRYAQLSGLQWRMDSATIDPTLSVCKVVNHSLREEFSLQTGPAFLLPAWDSSPGIWGCFQCPLFWQSDSWHVSLEYIHLCQAGYTFAGWREGTLASEPP